jgi:hypothetical protein
MRRVNIAAPQCSYDPDPEGFKAGLFRPGPDLGAKDTGLSIYDLPPGQAVCPYPIDPARLPAARQRVALAAAVVLDLVWRDAAAVRRRVAGAVDVGARWDDPELEAEVGGAEPIRPPVGALAVRAGGQSSSEQQYEGAETPTVHRRRRG